jgi:hypothetical protein
MSLANHTISAMPPSEYGLLKTPEAESERAFSGVWIQFGVNPSCPFHDDDDESSMARRGHIKRLLSAN